MCSLHVTDVCLANADVPCACPSIDCHSLHPVCLGFTHQLVTVRLVHITIGCHAGDKAMTRCSGFVPLKCRLVTCCMLRTSYRNTQQLYSMVCSRAMADLQNSTSRLVYITQHHCKVLCSGYCEEEEWIDLATVKGYRRVVMCQEVRDELLLNLTVDAVNAGEEEEEEEDQMQDWQRVVIAMCEGRLLPTPWLNKVMLHSSSALPPAYCTSRAASYSPMSILMTGPHLNKIHWLWGASAVSNMNKCIQATLTASRWECLLG